MNPIHLGKGPNGLPAIQWGRYGVAAKGEPSRVSEVVEYPSEAERDQALAAHLDHGGAKRPPEAEARKAIESWLDAHAPGYPTYSLCEDGEDGWAFWIADTDTTSYLHHDLRIEWYGTDWPDRVREDADTGMWVDVGPVASISKGPSA
jgi:hypothetical protein